MQSAVSILRVSTKKQLTEGEGIENQRRGNNEYIRKKGYRFFKEYVLAETADDKARTDFEGVVAEIVANKKRVDVVVFWKVDRISRGGVGAYYTLKALLAKHGIRVEFATEQIDASPAGELMESILAASARFENRVRVERTIGVEKILTREGYWCRAAPTGFVNGRTKDRKPILLAHPERRQWDMLAYGLQKQLTGMYKIGDVASEMREKGFRSNKGNPITRQDWQRLCHKPVYGGLICEKWTDYEFVRAKFDGPITPDQWYHLQQVLDDRNTIARRLPRQKLHADFPLRRFLRCPQCGSPVRGYAAVKKNGGRYRYYDCGNKGCRFRVPVAEAHKQFVDLLKEITPTPELLEGFRKIVLETWQEEYRELHSQSNDLQKKVARLRGEKQALLDLMKASAENPSLLKELQKDFERVDQALTLATMARSTTEIEEFEAEAVVTLCISFIQNVSELWQKWPVDLQNRLQALVFPEGVSYAALRGEANPKLADIYELLADSAKIGPMAAPRCGVTNQTLSSLIDWYKQLRGLPEAVKLGWVQSA